MNINLFLSTLSINVIGSFVLFLVFLIQWIRQRNKKSTSSDITILEADDGRVKLTQVIKDKGTLLLSIAFLIVTVFFGRTEYIEEVEIENYRLVRETRGKIGYHLKSSYNDSVLFYMTSKLPLHRLDMQIQKEIKEWYSTQNSNIPSLSAINDKVPIIILLEDVYSVSYNQRHSETYRRIRKLYQKFFNDYKTQDQQSWENEVEDRLINPNKYN